MEKTKKILKTISSFFVVALNFLLGLYPVQNTTAVNQLSDSVTSSGDAQLVSQLLVLSPIFTIVIILFIWKNEIIQFVKNSKNNN